VYFTCSFCYFIHSFVEASFSMMFFRFWSWKSLQALATLSFLAASVQSQNNDCVTVAVQTIVTIRPWNVYISQYIPENTVIYFQNNVQVTVNNAPVLLTTTALFTETVTATSTLTNTVVPVIPSATNTP
jgi:hypothetical protein